MIVGIAPDIGNCTRENIDFGEEVSFLLSLRKTYGKNINGNGSKKNKNGKAGRTNW
jgi:hypothetical protein